MRRLVHELHRVQKIESKLVKLMGAWPIRRLNPFMAGPARKCPDYKPKGSKERAEETKHMSKQTKKQVKLKIV